MLVVLIPLSSACQNEVINCSKAKVRIAVLRIMDVKPRLISKLVLFKREYRLRQFTREWLHNTKYSEYRPLFTTQDEWTIVKYVMEVLRPLQYWTLWMSKRHTVTLHHEITVYNDMCNHMDGMICTLAKKKDQWKEDCFIAVKLARQKLSKYYTEVILTTAMLFISAHILDSFCKLQ